MSQVRVSGNASGTGILTVTSPNTNTNYTLTLPANTGTLLSSATTGTVLQVVEGAQFASVTTTSGSTQFSSTTPSITAEPDVAVNGPLSVTNVLIGVTSL